MSLTLRPKNFDWDRPLVSFKWADSSFIDLLIDVHEAAGTPLELFLGIPDHSPRHTNEFPILNAICPDDILLAIREEAIVFPDHVVVWLHDRNLNGGSRLYSGVKSANTYFYPDALNPNNEEFLTYYENAEEIEWDAILMAELLVDRFFFNDPREYFRMALRVRGEKCKDEWRNVLYHIKSGIHKYLRAPHLPRLRQKQTLGNAEDQAEAIEKSEAWVKEVNSILTRLTGTLSKTIMAWDTFSLRDAALIERSFEPESSLHAEFQLHDIAVLADEFKKIQVDLKDLESLIEKFKAQASISCWKSKLADFLTLEVQ
ncbi:hypothetical protein CORC01_11295 [Colletotrichum orchidophilum]|uniref:Uncharacterized protein n=1 Tax=Colletotrichum orchidophilum TaxID=1209926 RepID=A0A1G4AW90_9PEZI|nr:uncharacterized protein CORC01_11295 [Colletotrichum orchidophilum]OHE93430.1 hypothetical protein CORC01_11295 [Colletotrichum orchidophilum]